MVLCYPLMTLMICMDSDVLMVAMMMMALKPLHLIGGTHDDVALGDDGAPVRRLVLLMHMVMVA